MASSYPHLTILVVIYNESPDTSASIKAVVALDGILGSNTIIWDNSIASQSTSFHSFFANAGFSIEYINTPENLSLSVIYNRVADSVTDDGFLLILDQDTVLPPNYLKSFFDAVYEHPDIKLFVPTIRVGRKLISPSPFFSGWGLAWRRMRIGRHSTRHITIINSGLFASLALFQSDGVRYDERLKLYGTDTDFFRSYSRREASFYILPVVVDHDLSFNTADIGNKAAKISQMFAANRIIYAPDGLFIRAGVAVVELIVRLRYALRYRSLLFFRVAD